MYTYTHIVQIYMCAIYIYYTYTCICIHIQYAGRPSTCRYVLAWARTGACLEQWAPQDVILHQAALRACSAGSRPPKDRAASFGLIGRAARGEGRERERERERQICLCIYIYIYTKTSRNLNMGESRNTCACIYACMKVGR